MSEFELHPQLAAESVPVSALELSSVRLVNDSHYPWLLLVPRRHGLVDLTDLAPADRSCLIEEINIAAKALKALCRYDKLNVASLGNQVPQLHIHIIARRIDDAAWPKPVWGVVPPAAYAPEQAERIVAKLKRHLPIGSTG